VADVPAAPLQPWAALEAAFSWLNGRALKLGSSVLPSHLCSLGELLIIVGDPKHDPLGSMIFHVFGNDAAERAFRQRSPATGQIGGVRTILPRSRLLKNLVCRENIPPFRTLAS
jgi:hypothetical protein